MIGQISWGEDLLIVCLLVAGYFTVMSALQFSPDRKNRHSWCKRRGMRKGKKWLRKIVKRDKPGAGKGFNSTTPSPDKLPNKVVPQENEEGRKLLNLTIQLSSVIMDTVARAAVVKSPRQELILALQCQMEEYGILNTTDFATGIDNLVKYQCQRVCSICLDEEELKMLWKAGQMELLVDPNRSEANSAILQLTCYEDQL